MPPCQASRSVSATLCTGQRCSAQGGIVGLSSLLPLVELITKPRGKAPVAICDLRYQESQGVAQNAPMMNPGLININLFWASHGDHSTVSMYSLQLQAYQT